MCYVKSLNCPSLLVACEESQIVTSAFRAVGYNAFSADLKPCSGGHPEWHIQGDCLPLLSGGAFTTSDGVSHMIPHWDMLIAHPPCTFLTSAGERWFLPFYDSDRHRWAARLDAAEFFMQFVHAPVPLKCIENPVGFMSSYYKKPTQIIQPFYFGDPVRKTTCLWLESLPPLVPTRFVYPELVVFPDGSTDSKLHYDTWHLPPDQRASIRSKFFPGVAAAMASQWSYWSFSLPFDGVLHV